MSLLTVLGRRGRLLDETAVDARMVMCESPILTLGQVDALRAQPERPALTLSMTYDVSGGPFAFRSSLEQVSRDAVAAVQSGVVILVLSDRDVDRDRAPLPALLATSVVSQALDREGLGTRAGLVIDTGEVRDAHQAASLLAFGASALCPWLAYTTASPPRRGSGRATPWRGTATHCSKACSRRCPRWACAPWPPIRAAT
jgi:glutamate synthase (NADPH/NADH) large chain/glutamate synthase (ferredoxin)